MRRTLPLELALVAAAAAFAFPLYALIVLSLKDPAQISAVSLGLPDAIETANYARAWEEATLGAALVNSTVITVASLLALVLCGSLAAYPLARARRRASHRLYLLFLLGITLPAQLAMVPLYRLVADVGLLGSYTAIVIVYTGMQLPLTVFLYAGFLRAQPREYEEAALIDGATHLQTFARITFPLLRPVTAVVLVINAVFIWNDFLTPLLYLGGSAKETVPVVVYGFVGQYGAQWGPIFAAVVLATLPMLLAFALLQRRALDGLRRGFRR